MKLIKVNVLKEWIENWFTKNRAYHPYAKNNNIPITELYDILERLPSAQPDVPDTNVGDMISRQAAIDAIEDTDWYHQNKNKDMVHGANSSEHQAWYKAEDVHKALEQLPSAQPEITLESAIDYLHSIGWMQEHDKILTESAQPEPKKGKWKRTYLDHEAMGERPSILYCSECSQCIAYPTNYCPNCGAEMEKE